MAQNTSRLQQSSDLKTLRLFLPPGDRVGEHACLLHSYTCTQKATMISHGIFVLPGSQAVSPWYEAILLAVTATCAVINPYAYTETVYIKVVINSSHLIS